MYIFTVLCDVATEGSSDSDNDNKTGAIVGAVVGGAGGLALICICIAIFWYMKKRKNFNILQRKSTSMYLNVYMHNIY